MDFIRTNIKLLSFYFIALAGVFSFVTILPTLLKVNYGIGSDILSYGTTVFIVTYMLSSIYHTQYIDKAKEKVFRATLILYIIDIISTTSLIVIFYMGTLSPDVVTWIFILSRILNGWCGGGITSLIGYIIKLKLYKEKNNTKINGVIDSFYSFIKLVMPIVGAFASEIMTPLTPMIIAVVLMMISIYILLKDRRKIYFTYMLSLSRANNEAVEKKHAQGLAQAFKTYLRKNKYRPVRIHYLVNLFLRNSVRPYFDFFIPLYLVTTHSYLVSEAAIVSSWMVIGMILQFLTTRSAQRMTTGVYQGVSNIMMSVCIFILALSDDIYTNPLHLSIVMFVVGVSTGMKGNWNYRLINRIGRDGVKLSHTTLIGNIIGGSSVYIVLLLMGAMFATGTGETVINSIMIVLSSSLVVVSILEVMMDRSYRIKKKMY